MPAGIIVPTFPQRSPPWLLTTAACGGLRSTPDYRTRRTFLHLPYSCAAPCGPAMLVTQGPTLPTWALQQVVGYLGYTGRGPDALTTAALDPQQASTACSCYLTMWYRQHA